MLNVRVADDHLFRKLLFTWLSLVMFLSVSSVLSVYPQDVLDEIWDLIESISECFPTYACTKRQRQDITSYSQVNSYFSYS